MTDPAAHGITVRGTGLASAAPDVFIVDVAAEAAAATPLEAFTAAGQMTLAAGGPPVEAGALAVTASVTVSWAWG